MGLQEKNTQAHVGGHSIGCLTNTTEGCQGHEKWGNTEKLSQTRGDLEDTSKCNVVPWTEFWNRKVLLMGKLEKSK